MKIRMASTPSRYLEMPLRSSLPLASNHSYCSSPSLHTLLFFPLTRPKPSFQILKPFSSLRTGQHNKSPRSRREHQNPKPSAPWLDKWPPSSPAAPISDKRVDSDALVDVERAELDARTDSKIRYLKQEKGQSAIERIVLRLRNLGLESNDEDGDDEGGGIDGEDPFTVTGEERLGDLLKREWIRPDTVFVETKGSDEYETLLPWEKDEEEETEQKSERGTGVLKMRKVRTPTLADLTIEDSELRRLRRVGMYLREKINIPKAGLTQAVMEKIHDRWRKNELVRLKFHEVLSRDMKTAHEIVERRTAGLVIWKAGSVMVVYRGSNYQGPSTMSQKTADGPKETAFVPDVSSTNTTAVTDENDTSLPSDASDPVSRNQLNAENMTEEEAEFNSLLDSFGPRFHEWWGTGILPVDADLLPPKIPGYKTPFRLLPTGMRSRLTNAEMTNYRKMAKALPCHFALGRNRNHQGLAAAIIKLWEKSLVAKIAVKRGIQNTNNKLMADELKDLTGGVLLLRNKYYIVIYRGKDFLPSSVAATLAERQELTKEIQVDEEKLRNQGVETVQSVGDGAPPQAGTLAEFYEAQAQWRREISPEEHERMIEEASRAKRARVVKRIEHKLSIAQAKMQRAEVLLSKIEAAMVPSGPDYDQEIITDEERVMFRGIGLKMKAYLPLGVRGVFDGVIENMHLHWKHRELVKLISKQKNLTFVEDTARLLEYESGGVLVAIDKLPKGHALIYYRGKNYQRPISIRPRNLLTKAKALKRSVAMQRHEALSQHINELEKTIEQMMKELNEKEPSYEESETSDESEDEDDDDDAYDDDDSDWEEADDRA